MWGAHFVRQASKAEYHLPWRYQEIYLTYPTVLPIWHTTSTDIIPRKLLTAPYIYSPFQYNYREHPWNWCSPQPRWIIVFSIKTSCSPQTISWREKIYFAHRTTLPPGQTSCRWQEGETLYSLWISVKKQAISTLNRPQEGRITRLITLNYKQRDGMISRKKE